ncbi:MAG: hypothetical protein ABIP95_15640 [Pelobium sp.]
MKTTSLKVMIVISLFAFVACTNNSEKKATSNSDSLMQNYRPLDSVPAVLASLKSTKANIKAYDSICRIQFKTIPIKSFTVRAVDLFGAMGMPGNYADNSICKYPHIRVYLGYDVKLGVFKLYVVPVEGADLAKGISGKDVILNKKGIPITKKENMINGGNDQYVLDLNAPCPNTCDETSPLMN